MMRRRQDPGEQHGTFCSLEGGVEDYGCEKSGEVLEVLLEVLEGQSGLVMVMVVVAVVVDRPLEVRNGQGL